MRSRWTLALCLCLGLAVAGCGGGRQTSTARSTKTDQLAPSTTTASTDCNALGINPTQMREGTCTHAGITYTIVDEDHTLRLQTLWARLDGVRAVSSLGGGTVNAAGGRFIVASVTVTNRLPSPQGFDKDGTQQAGLILGGALFKEDVSAERQADPTSCLNRDRVPIQPGKSQTCDVIFLVPAAAAAQLGRHGSGDLYLVDFGSDLAAGSPPQRIGQIRLYR